ncbi:MAG: hypothetical protein OEZ19_00040 [Paracoccaceae bacterium]|nr:hypothetical protein [Paracoccaceae bacterium]
MLVKCISDNFAHVHWFKDAQGTWRGRKIVKGDTFNVIGIPPHWARFVIPVKGERVAVTNPAESPEMEALKARYKEVTGRAPRYTWDADTIRAKLDEKTGDSEGE